MDYNVSILISGALRGGQTGITMSTNKTF